MTGLQILNKFLAFLVICILWNSLSTWHPALFARSLDLIAKVYNLPQSPQSFELMTPVIQPHDLPASSYLLFMVFGL